MINATQIRKGMALKLNREIYKVLEAVHVAPGNWKAVVQTKLRSLRDHTLVDHRFRSNDRVEQAFLEKVEMEYLFRSGDEYVFMNLENYEQIKLPKETIEDAIHYLVPNVVFSVETYEGNPVAIEPPMTVDLKVVKTAPFIKGATQAASSKPAELETGLTVSVPQFIKEGDVVRIDTREDKYLERVKG